MDAKPSKPGDGILDRYMPDASDEAREEARSSLYAYVALMRRIALRLAREEAERSDSPESQSRDRV